MLLPLLHGLFSATMSTSALLNCVLCLLFGHISAHAGLHAGHPGGEAAFGEGGGGCARSGAEGR